MIERALKGARLPPASGARARGEMDAGGLACAAIGTCLRNVARNDKGFGDPSRALEIGWTSRRVEEACCVSSTRTFPSPRSHGVE